MNRRDFLRKMLETGLAMMAGSMVLAKNSIRKFIRAEKAAYPGRIGKPTNIEQIGKWSG